MESFDQLIALANEASDRFREFVKIDRNATTMEEALDNHDKSVEICKAIHKKLDEVKMEEHGSGYAYDRCVYYMVKDALNMYEYATLIVLATKMGGRLAELNKQLKEKQKKQTKNRKKSRKRLA